MPSTKPLSNGGLSLNLTAQECSALWVVGQAAERDLCSLEPEDKSKMVRAAIRLAAKLKNITDHFPGEQP